MADLTDERKQEESRAFGARLKETWEAMSDDEQIQFVLDLPYRFILDLKRRYGQHGDRL